MISYNINNQGKMELVQQEHDGEVLLTTEYPERDGVERKEWAIPAGDMVMLMNYYRNCKENGREIC